VNTERVQVHARRRDLERGVVRNPKSPPPGAPLGGAGFIRREKSTEQPTCDEIPEFFRNFNVESASTQLSDNPSKA